MEFIKKHFKKIIIAILGLFTLSAAAATTLMVQQGGTGANTLTGILVGNGISPFTTNSTGALTSDINFDDGTFVISYDDNRVGIGTTTPVEKLDINGVSSIGAISFTGGGLNDLTVGGTYIGGSIQNFKIEIDTEGTPDKFKWSIDDGVNWIETAVSITGSSQALNYTGLTISFVATTGHTLGNSWSFVATPPNGVVNVSGNYSIDGKGILQTHGANNVFIGENSNSQGKNTGYGNVGIGYASLNANKKGYGNLAIGDSSLYLNTNGANNVSIGYLSLYSSLTGSTNVGIGYRALYSNITGESNISIGSDSSYTNATGLRNTVIGYRAMRYSNGSYQNTTIGGYTGYNNLAGYNNTLLGYKAGYGVTGNSNSNNIFIGYQAGNSVTTGSDNIVIGYDEDLPLATTSNHLNIGGLIYGDLSGGNVGVATVTPDTKFQVVGDVKFGDDNTNYISFATDGELTLTGTARIKNALWIPASGLKAPGSKPATYIEHGLDGAWSFADQAIAGNQETISGMMRIPERMDRSVASSFIIGWSADGIDPGDCKWQLEYLWTAPNEATNAGAQETLTTTVTASSTSNGLIISEITGVDVPSSTDVCFHFKITRLSADANDTIADNVEILGICNSFTSNKLGSAL